jgi:hypothetical protein
MKSVTLHLGRKPTLPMILSQLTANTSTEADEITEAFESVNLAEDVSDEDV